MRFAVELVVAHHIDHRACEGSKRPVEPEEAHTDIPCEDMHIAGDRRHLPAREGRELEMQIRQHMES